MYRPLRYPQEGQMSSFKAYHDLQDPSQLTLVRWSAFQRNLAIRLPIELDSQEWYEFSARKSCFRYPYGNPGTHRLRAAS